MHKARLKKLETKQRAQEELRKRDAEIQRVREPEARTPFNNYRKHIAGLLYRNIVSIVPPFWVLNWLHSTHFDLVQLRSFSGYPKHIYTLLTFGVTH